MTSPSPSPWRRWLLTIIPIGAALCAFVSATLLLTELTASRSLLDDTVPWLLGLNVSAIIALLLSLIWRTYELYQQRRAKVPGAELRSRLALIFVLLSLPPVVIVFAFSLRFLNESVDSWFDVEVDEALSGALDLGQLYLDDQLSAAIGATREVKVQLQTTPADDSLRRLSALRSRVQAEELSLFGVHGQLLGARFSDPSKIAPDFPDSAALVQARSEGLATNIEPTDHDSLQIRVLMRLDEPGLLATPPRLMQAIFPVDEKAGALIGNIEDQYARFRRLSYLQGPLKFSFGLILTLVLVLTMLLAVLAALTVARRAVRPLQALAGATREIAAGRYQELPARGRDELAFLVRAFNAMSRRLARADQATRASQARLEAERSYLETVLGRLSAGVLTFDKSLRLAGGNNAASQILNVDWDSDQGQSLGVLEDRHAELAPLWDAIREQWPQSEAHDWSRQLQLPFAGQSLILICRGALFLQPDSGAPAYVLVFDDITALVQAQREAAWGEVARRLAHEVKNPLTPIQLAAERMQLKLKPSLNETQESLLERSTRTIVNQVDALKQMVDQFSDYAKPLSIDQKPVDLHALCRELLELYGAGEAGLTATFIADAKSQWVYLDSARMRQVLHNLLRNAADAMHDHEQRRVVLRIEQDEQNQTSWVSLSLRDEGPGFDLAIIGRLFEPYATTKQRGTGLGLAIVRKIIEEHGGSIHAENNPGTGACITIRLPQQGAASQRRKDKLKES